MTRMRGGSGSPPEAARSPYAGDRPSGQRAKLPPNAPEVIIQNTIYLTDGAYVLPWHKEERRRQFNLLVRRYKNQLLYGCQDANCMTPTCLSYRKRATEGPFRRYTELSARTLACYLASLDNAESGLCRNPPRQPSDFPPADSSRRSKRRNNSRRSTDEGAVKRPDLNRGDSKDTGRQQSRSLTTSGNQTTEPARIRDTDDRDTVFPPSQEETQPEYAPEGDGSGTQRMKDPKSFTQNLFDTISVRMVEWLPLRRSSNTVEPMDLASSARIPRQQRDGNKEKSQTPSGRGNGNRHGIERTVCGQQNNTARTGAIRNGVSRSSSQSVSAQPTAVEVKLPGQPVKRLSFNDVEHWRQNARLSADEKARRDIQPKKLSVTTPSNAKETLSLPSPPALRHRRQKHGSTNMDGVTFNRDGKKKANRRVSWDGSKLLNDSPRHRVKTQDLPLDDEPASTLRTDQESQVKVLRGHRKHDAPLSVQTVDHLSMEIVCGLSQMLLSGQHDAESWQLEISAMEASGNLEEVDLTYARSEQREAFSFIAQSVFYNLSNPNQILRSFQKREAGSLKKENGLVNASLDIEQLEPTFRQLLRICPWDIVLHSLWTALETVFAPPKDLSTPIRSRRQSAASSNSASNSAPPVIPVGSLSSSCEDHMSDAEAAYMVTVALFGLVGSLPELDPQTWRDIVHIRSAGTVMPDAEVQKLPQTSRALLGDVTDRLEHELALRLLNRLVRALTTRLAFREISKARQTYGHDSPKLRKNGAIDIIIDTLREHHSTRVKTTHKTDDVSRPLSSLSAASVIVEWLRTLFLKEWDGKAEVARSSAAGGAVQILASMYKDRDRLGLPAEDFHTAFLSERLDPMEMPVAWLGTQANNKTIHVLSYSFLFPPQALVIYFRALNYATMSKSYEAAMTATRHITQTAFGQIPIYDDVGLLARLRTSTSTYLVLVVRRDDVLTDALNQLWRREKRELLRPLKVQMGMDEGEEGVDHGGVQQEFFRVVMAQALDPSYGMFTMDSRTRISWFQPCSLEPLYKFELLGLLMSLAVYNGVTLPVNFPIALYRKLLGLKVKRVEHIKDGWPELCRGLEELLNWKDGDVGDIFMRTYEFSFDVFGTVNTVDMEKVHRDAYWPVFHSGSSQDDARNGLSGSHRERRQYSGNNQPVSTMLKDENENMRLPLQSFRTGVLRGVEYDTPLKSSALSQPEEASLVTNENRHQFVKDYIFWLTDKSIRRQYEAFARGFYTCLDRTALSIFTPEALKTVVEGIQDIDLDQLERHARYDGGFSASHRVIRDFWHVVRHFSTEKKRQLLEFVTASDRVPVNGIASIMFVIQKNGVGDARLPTSLTCFGRLLLPEYTSKSVLQEKLEKALENARGFGVA
ncbi:HECT domain protein [Paecilomyces variotii No. 5]|uniref:HECT-type E3 ubiquitin transferase n=1 Tax=Byssochlamys spectabilis (strain No. 5 / NBRC 109023) TaxID=1356009 RepID=V5FRS8_BYSSN|nr:HECT domain protein [Paecilomyces variotii No. 5]